jgi:acyl-CoA synthetase (NDP forming)
MVDPVSKLNRLLNPIRIAVIGGGAWCASIISAAQRIGFEGEIVPVHPSGKVIADRTSVSRVEDISGPIDAAFIGINRHATIDAIASLAALGAGGAVCFASGFSEALAEDETGGDLQARLIAAAGNMPVLGPNCYGFINALDRVAIWPDQHGMLPVESGVAILTQSSNIAINLTMQQRGLPIAYMVTCGNMAQTSQAAIASSLLDDPRVTAIGLHIEGFGDLREWESLAQKAHAKGVPLVAIKVGVSEQAQQATVSHTASLAGSDAGAQAFLDRLGIARLRDLPAFLETLKLLHCTGPLASNRIASISCSGGEASLIADLADAHDLVFPPLSKVQESRLRDALGPMVALANPLDYHTYIWRDAVAMTKAWSGLTGNGIAMTFSIVDYPHTDSNDWDCATQAALNVRETGAPFAVVATLPELMPEHVACTLMEGGVVPFMGLREALCAVEAAVGLNAPDPDPLLLPQSVNPDVMVSEAEAKQALAEHGITIPNCRVVAGTQKARQAALGLQEPLAVKGVGLAHKTEQGAVRLGLKVAEIAEAAGQIGTDVVLIEEMVVDGIAEILIGITRDPAHGYVLTLGAGGVLTEILEDTVSLLVPSRPDQIETALMRLKCAPLLTGYRGKPAADLAAIVAAVQSVQDYVIANADTVSEVEINPLICTPNKAVAVDALIRKAK